MIELGNIEEVAQPASARDVLIRNLEDRVVKAAIAWRRGSFDYDPTIPLKVAVDALLEARGELTTPAQGQSDTIPVDAKMTQG